MTLEFAGVGLPLDAEALAEASDKLGVRAAEIWAVLTVETCGCGFLSDRRPLILFERHIFHRETGGRLDASAPDVSNPHPGGYGGPGSHQYERLARAIGLDRRAALRSASWGIGQVMGFNAEIAGWLDVEAMVAAMGVSEGEQLRGLIGEIVRNRLDRALRAHDWATFARGYNGPAYARNQYDHRLACCYEDCCRGRLPDLQVRAAQLFLAYLGFPTWGIDGWFGRKTRSALNDFQRAQGLPVTDELTDDVFEVLRAKAIPARVEVPVPA